MPESEGMLDGSSHILQTACPEIGWSTPYFNKTDETETINDYIYKTVEKLNDEKIDFKDRFSEVPGLNLLPDGAFWVKEASMHSLKYNLQIDDNRYFQYHRNNGITKLGIVNPLTNQTALFLRPIEGQLAAADMIHKAYINRVFPDTYIFTGV